MAQQTNQQHNNKALIIVLSIVGGLVILGGVSFIFLVVILGDYPGANKTGPSENEITLQNSVADKITIENGVRVSTHVDGFSPALSVRLYVDTDDVTAIARAVDQTFEVAWLSWPKEPSSITVGVIVGEMPANPELNDVNRIDLDEVAATLGISPKDVHINILLSEGQLRERYGARS